MKVLVACEESQQVCIAFREKGHEAYSCDIMDCSGGHPEWHIKQDVLPLLGGDCKFTTCDGGLHTISGKWDMIIAHPPCTYLTNACTRGFSLRVTEPAKVVDRWEKRAKAAVFFMHFVYANSNKIAIENPCGFMSTAWRKPDQYIDPYMFATSVNDTENYVTKRTGLWLKNLPKLIDYGLPRPNNAELFGRYSNGKSKCWEDSVVRTAKSRSKTFPGIAKAMAEQWGDHPTEKGGEE